MRARFLVASVGCWVLVAAGGGVASAEPSEHPFEIVPGSFRFAPSTLQAGAHSDWVTSFDFAHEPSGRTDNDVRNIVVNLPAGFDASNTAVPTCSQAQLIEPWPFSSTENVSGELSDCPPASQVGLISLEISGSPTVPVPTQYTVPVYNMEVLSRGTTAELGFDISNVIVQLLHVSVRPGDTGLTVTTPNISRIGEVHNVTVTTWGVPGSSVHDAQRGEICGAYHEDQPVCREE